MCDRNEMDNVWEKWHCHLRKRNNIVNVQKGLTLLFERNDIIIL